MIPPPPLVKHCIPCFTVLSAWYYVHLVIFISDFIFIFFSWRICRNMQRSSVHWGPTIYHLFILEYTKYQCNIAIEIFYHFVSNWNWCFNLYLETLLLYCFCINKKHIFTLCVIRQGYWDSPPSSFLWRLMGDMSYFTYVLFLPCLLAAALHSGRRRVSPSISIGSVCQMGVLEDVNVTSNGDEVLI